MVGIIDGVRWSLFDAPLSATAFWSAVIWSVAILLAGFWCFRRMENEFADYI